MLDKGFFEGWNGWEREKVSFISLKDCEYVDVVVLDVEWCFLSVLYNVVISSLYVVICNCEY